MKKILFLCLLAFAFQVQADVVCVKKRVAVKNNRIALAKNVKVENSTTCPRGFNLIKDLATSGEPIAFGRISGTASALSYGGANVTGINTQLTGAGEITVTLLGNFPELSENTNEANRVRLTVMSTAESDAYGVTNNYVDSASRSEIRIKFYVWQSSTLALNPQLGFHFTVMLGKPVLL